MKPKKNISTFHIEKNAFVDAGDGVIEFPQGLVITDGSEQWNGTRYDIPSMDISEYKGQLTANHSSQIQEMIGKVGGTKKIKDQVLVNSIRYAIQENALARFTYNMMVAGFVTDFSIETIGPWPDEDGIYHDAKLVGLSVVVAGNNKSATINENIEKIVVNSIEECEQKGIDSSTIKDLFKNTLDKNEVIDNNKSMKFVAIKNTRSFDVTVKYKNLSEEEIEKILTPNETIDVSENQKEAIEAQINSAKAPEKKVETNQPDIAEIVKQAIAPLTTEIEKMKKEAQEAFDSNAVEPSFRKESTSLPVGKNASTELGAMSYKQRHTLQIQNAWDHLKGGNAEAGRKLETINKFHMEQLMEKGIVENSVTLGDFGNFVISPELLTDIQGFRSNYQPLVSKLDYQETLSLQMAWLNRTGDIDMQPVEICDDGANGNLKPISDYGAEIETSDLEELAAVTPVCNAVTRFLAADLLGDVAKGYRNDYDRKKAQLFIARLQQAVDANGNSVIYSTTSGVNAISSFIDVVGNVSEEIMNGTYILNNASKWQIIKRAIASGISGDVLGIVKSGDLTPLLGAPAIIVPNDLLPTLNTAQTKSFIVNGTTVTINKAVFYADLSNFKGRVSGGLKYDLSTEAAYEQNGVVKSAYQRNELVIRGSFFRGGAILEEDQVSALQAPGVS